METGSQRRVESTNHPEERQQMLTEEGMCSSNHIAAQDNDIAHS